MLEFINTTLDWLLSPIKWVANKLRAKVTVKHELKVEKAINDITTAVKVVNRKTTELVAETCFSLVDDCDSTTVVSYGVILTTVLMLMSGFITQGLLLPVAVMWFFYNAIKNTLKNQNSADAVN